MALADRTLTSMESFEPRRLLAFAASGTAGVLVSTGVTAVESAAARPDATNFTHYATILTGTATGVVAQVTGADASAGAGSVNAINNPANTTISNTDVAANNPSANTYVVVWQTTSTATAPGGGMGGGTTTADVINAQVFSNSVAVSGVIQVNQTGTGNATNGRVAMAGDGTFVVVWEGTQTGGQTQVFARRFSATGSPLANQVQISAATQTAGNSGVEPDVAANANGQYVIAWVNDTDTLAETFNANGTATSDPITVAAATFTEPAVGVFSTGGFVVAYAGAGTGGGAATQILAQRYNSSGIAVGGLAEISTAATGPAGVPELAVATNNSYAIGWAQAATATPSVFDALAFNTYSSSGVVIGPETTLSGVSFGADDRFGLAYRVPGHLDVVYDQAGAALDQTYLDSAAGGGGSGGTTPSTGNEIAVPAGALLIDQTASTVGQKITVNQTSTQIQVDVDGTTTNYTRSSYSSIYLRAGTGSDLITFNGDVTLPATIYGRDGSDIIYGGSGNDLIDGENGWDQIQGGAGNDTVLGGGGRNTLFGGSGDDLISAGGGDEDVGGGGLRQPNTTAGRNADSTDRQTLLLGENGNDTLTGNGGASDAFYGQGGNDSITGGDGADLIYGGLGNDSIEGGAGNDRLYGDRGADLIQAGEGDDFVSGGRDNDDIFGNAGNDTLYGDSGADRVFGGGNGRQTMGSTPGDIGYIDGTDTYASIEFVLRVR